MQLIKYLSKLKIIIIYSCLLLIYSILNISNEKSWYSFYQHPYFTLGIIYGYLIIIFQFDFNNTMSNIRFRNYEKYTIYFISKLNQISTLYFFVLYLLILALGLLFNDEFTIAKVFNYTIYTILSLILVNIFYVMFSIKYKIFLLKIFLYCIVALSFCLNFAGKYFVNINLFFFNIRTSFTLEFLLNSILIYSVLLFLIYLISNKKAKDF